MCKKLVYIIPLVLALTVVLTSTASAELVGWWKLDDGSGTIAVDSSGSGLDGTLEGDPQWVEGWIGGALEFDGDDHVDTGYTEDLAIWTIACWVTSPQAPASGDPSGPIHRENNYQINWTHTSGDWQGSAGVNVGGWYNATFGDIEANRWYHLAATYDGEDLKAYKDGSLTATSGLPSGDPTPEPSSLKLARHALNVQYFAGTVDDVQIFNHALSEFDLHAIAAPNYQQSWRPRPANGEVDVLLDSKIVWNQGIVSRETFELYDEHQLYIGTDFNDVNSATEPTTILTDVNEYVPSLDYNITYYWRVDEASSLDPDNLTKGEVWSFTAANFIVLEDFEDYNDSPPNEIFMTWIDGWGDASNGSTAGYPDPDFVGGGHYVETDIVHGGNQSMPVFYDNSAGLSEATKTLTQMRDWTVDDVITLTLFYFGDAGNAIEPMYVALNSNAVVTNDNPRAALESGWNQWDILLQDFADQGVDLTNVNSVSIGFGNKANPAAGGEGRVFFDDLRLSRSEPQVVEPQPEPVDPGNANLQAYYAFENNVQDDSGNGYNGTLSGDPQYVSSATGFGMGMEFDGIGDHVTLPIGTLLSSLNDCSFTMWVNYSGQGNAWQRVIDFGTGETVNMFLTPNAGSSGLRFAITTGGGGDEEQTTTSQFTSDGWHHVAITIDPGNTTHTLYLNGKVAAQNVAASYVPANLGETNQNWIGRSQYPADPYYIGSVDEFRIYDKVLSQPEVRFLAGK